MTNKTKPDCLECKYRQSIPGDAHSECTNTEPHKVKGNPVGIRGGWFNYPYNYDLLWVISCDGFVRK